MFKNKLPLSSIIGIGTISTGSFFLFIVASDLNNESETQFVQFFLLLGLFFFLTGIGMIFKRNWIRPLLAISFVSFGAFLLYTTFISDYLKFYQSIGNSIFGIGITLFLVLLLYNEKVSEEFGIKHQDKMDDEILDIIE